MPGGKEAVAAAAFMEPSGPLRRPVAVGYVCRDGSSQRHRYLTGEPPLGAGGERLFCLVPFPLLASERFLYLFFYCCFCRFRSKRDEFE